MNIKNARKRKGWTQEKLSEKMNRSVSFVTKVENGYLGKANDVIYEFMEALDIDANTIFACDQSNSIDLKLARMKPEVRAYFSKIFLEMIEKYPG